MTVSRILIFFAVIIGLTVGTHYYLWARLIRDPAWPAPWRQLATVALVVLGTSVPLSMIIWRVVPREVAIPVAWVGYIWMGAMFLVLVLLWGGELARWGWFKVAEASTGDVDLERRFFFARSLAGGAAVLGAALSASGVWSAIRPVEVRRLAVKIGRLPDKLSGLRIVQLTDMHVGPTIGRDFVEHVVREVNMLDADIVAITGDMVDGSVPELAHALEPLGDLRAKDGVFFVTGNHEYYSGADEWLSFLPSLGIRPLRNERVEIRREDHALDLAGIDDWTAHQFGGDHGADLDRALHGRDTSRPVVLLAHQPKAFHGALESGVDLQLSGHTHGGQIFPFGFLTRLVQPFLSGLHRREDTQIYVSNGTGYWGPPMRLGAPAEITLIELTQSTATSAAA